MMLAVIKNKAELPSEKSLSISYRESRYEMLNSNNSPKILHSLQTILSTAFLIEYTEIIRLLDSDSETCRKIALNLVLLDKPYYEPEDVNKLKIISEKIQQVFRPLSLITKKKMFLGGEKDVWEAGTRQWHSLSKALGGHPYG